MLTWFAVALVYSGLIGMLTGAISVARPIRALGHQTRLSAVAFFSAAAMLLITGVFLPAPLQSISTPQDDLDRTMPAWQFGEHHATRVRATPERVDAAIRQVTADIALFRTLTAPSGDGTSDLTTETRVFAVDRQATRAFAAYWRMIYPGSALIRIMWLRAIRLRAEA